MDDIDNKQMEIQGEELSFKRLKLSASDIIMPDGKTLADTIIIMNNRIQKLEETVEQLREKS